jgi:hypothetical protein
VRRLVSSSLVVGTVVAGVIGVSATSAFAWTVSGSTFTATNVGTVQFKDTATNQTFTCTASTINARVSSTAVITITSGTFSGCTGSLSSIGTGTISTGTLTPVSYLPTPAPGTTSYVLTGLAATLSIHNLLGTCNAAISGSANNVKYSNTGTLTFTADPAPGNLKFPSASGSGCTSLIVSGDRATFAGKYTVSPVITITNP